MSAVEVNPGDLVEYAWNDHWHEFGEVVRVEKDWVHLTYGPPILRSRVLLVVRPFDADNPSGYTDSPLPLGSRLTMERV